MKIVAPLGKVDDVAPLVRAGADEVYCGLVPPDWSATFGAWTAINRRNAGNLASYEELDTVTKQAHALGKTVTLTLNASHYSESQSKYLLDFAGRISGIGVDAVLVSDSGLIVMLAERRFPFKIFASSLCACRNSSAARFYQDIGGSRVILPRDMSLEEINGIVSAVPEVEFETFIMNEGCLFEEGLCHTTHLPNNEGGAFCLDNYRVEYRRHDGEPLPETERRAIEQNERDYREWTWYRFGCGFTVTEEGAPHGPCGLCAMPTLDEIGVTALKIVGREAGLLRKVRSVQMIKAVRDMIDAGKSAAEIRGFAQGLRRREQLCESGYMCYFPDFIAHPGKVACHA
ncbi:MAG: hypothetical protein A2Z34_09655 [Planctomycetes bacterium RBG_16_59_8]|nr:MAG: hypothetical protein A2Z34_09655 [Planctomycetes bacterium RBG_16_59_8]